MAPHGQFEIGKDGAMKTSDPIPAARHAHLFKDVKSKVFFFKNLPSE